MAVPGAGLLALLRKRPEGEQAPGALGVVAPTATTPASGGKFEARSSAVHALEHAVAAGRVTDVVRPAAQGRRVPPGPSYTFDVDVHEPREAQPQLPVSCAGDVVGAGMGWHGGMLLGSRRLCAGGPASGPFTPRPTTYCPSTPDQRRPLAAHVACPPPSPEQVTPVTLINTDFALHHYRQNAVSGQYICYGLKQVRSKQLSMGWGNCGGYWFGHLPRTLLLLPTASHYLPQGHIRVLSRHSAVRALLKGHAKPLTDLQFSSGAASGGLLASGGQDGQLFVWQLRLDEDAAAIRDTQLLHASFVSGGGEGQGGRAAGTGRARGRLLWWHGW